MKFIEDFLLLKKFRQTADEAFITEGTETRATMFYLTIYITLFEILIIKLISKILTNFLEIKPELSDICSSLIIQIIVISLIVKGLISNFDRITYKFRFLIYFSLMMLIYYFIPEKGSSTTHLKDNFPLTLVEIIFNLSLGILVLTATIKRLHDVGKSGWFQLWSLTIIGIPVVLYYIFLKKNTD